MCLVTVPRLLKILLPLNLSLVHFISLLHDNFIPVKMSMFKPGPVKTTTIYTEASLPHPFLPPIQAASEGFMPPWTAALVYPPPHSTEGEGLEGVKYFLLQLCQPLCHFELQQSRGSLKKDVE